MTEHLRGPRVSAALGEGIAQVVSAPLRIVSAVVGSAVLMMAGLVFPLLGVQSAVASATSSAELGSNIVLVASKERGALPAERCDAAMTISGVEASGAILGAVRSSVDGFPYSTMNIVRVTPGMVQVAWPNDAAMGGVVATPSARDAFGLSAGSRLRVPEFSQQLVEVGGTPYSQSRVKSLNGALVSVEAAHGQAVDECFVAASFGNRAAIEEIMLSWFGPHAEVIAAPYVPGSDDPRTVLHERRVAYQEYAPTLSAAICGAGLVALGWYRRREFAIFRTSGFGGLRLALVVLPEYMTISVLSAAISVSGSALVLLNAPDPLSTELLRAWALECAAVLTVFAVLFYAIARQGSVVAAMKSQ